MGSHTGTGSAQFDDADIERWGQDAEAGFPGATFGASSPGRPISVGEDARPLTIRLDGARRAKLRARAAEQHTNVSQVLRGLIDSM